MSKVKRGFGSDNHSGIHPEVLEAIISANSGHAAAYGADPWTERAEGIFRRHFGSDIGVYFVFNGTAANVLSLRASAQSFDAILCAESAHINVDECGAPELFTGCKLRLVPSVNGKISAETLHPFLEGKGNQHSVQTRVISISQTTELGTVYSVGEIRALSSFAKKNGLLLHMDGARLSNAAVSLGLGLREFTRDAGVDVLSFGGTKNGLMAAEAVVFLNPELAKDFIFVRKQGMQLASKMRFQAVQFEALLGGDLWSRNASHANKMAKLLEAEVRKISKVEIVYPVEANVVFAKVSKKSVPLIQDKFTFYVWKEGERTDLVRWMTSFDTTEQDVRGFVEAIREHS